MLYRVNRSIIIGLFTALLMIGVYNMRGYPDWNVDTGSSSLSVFDPVEAIMRAGVPGPFLRTGRVVYADSFEASLAPWEIVTGVNYGTVELDSVYSFRGAQCLKLTPTTTGQALASVRKRIPYVVTGKVGVEALIWGDDDADYGYIGAGIRVNDVFTSYTFRLTFATATLGYYDSDGDYIDVLTIGSDIGGEIANFVLMKLVANPIVSEYSYIQLNNQRVNLYGITGYPTPLPGPDFVRIELRAKDLGGDQGVVRFDDVVVTMNEP